MPGISLALLAGELGIARQTLHESLARRQRDGPLSPVTAVILNDIHASAVQAQVGGAALWTCVLDEFGAVVATAADQALALLQRGRTHEGQVLVVTQSVADIEALTGQAGLLASMADNFAAFVVHRQSAPESRDWLAKLMGTSALWQSTDQTSAYAATGAGSRRRVREFRVSSDTFAELRIGEAVIHTTLGPPPTVCQVTALRLPSGHPLLRIASEEPSACEMTVHPAVQLPAVGDGEVDSRAQAPPVAEDLGTQAPRARRVRAARQRADEHADGAPDPQRPQRPVEGARSVDDV